MGQVVPPSRNDPFQVIWLALPILLCLIPVWTANEFPRDFWLHANHGRLMWNTGQMVHADQFTHTIDGQPVLNQPWLAQLTFFGLYSAGAYALVQFVTGVAYALAVGIVAWTACLRARAIVPAAALTVIAVAIMMSNLGVRPQAFSVVFFAAQLAVLWQVRSTKLMITLVAVIELFWANMHGAFPLGIVLPCIFFAGSVGESLLGRNRTSTKDQPYRYLLAAAAAGVVMFATPQGTDIIQYVVGVSAKASERQIEEWLPTRLDTFAGRAFWMTVIPAFALITMRWRRARLTEILLLIAFAYLAMKCQRMVSWWALVWPTVLSPHVSAVFSKFRTAESSPSTSSVLVNTVAITLLLLVVVVSTPWTKQYNLLLPVEKRESVSIDEPTGAVRFLAERRIQGRMYQPMEWGSYFTWSLDPSIKVFVDSRIDFFPDEVWSDYVHAGASAKRTSAVLSKYGINVVVCDHRRSKILVGTMQSLPEWQEAFSDHNSVIFLKTGTMPASDKTVKPDSPAGV